MPQPRTDVVTLAALVAENATLAAENATLRGLVDAFTRAMRDLPPGSYPRSIKGFWDIVQANPAPQSGT